MNDLPEIGAELFPLSPRQACHWTLNVAYTGRTDKKIMLRPHSRHCFSWALKAKDTAGTAEGRLDLSSGGDDFHVRVPAPASGASAASMTPTGWRKALRIVRLSGWSTA